MCYSSHLQVRATDKRGGDVGCIHPFIQSWQDFDCEKQEALLSFMGNYRWIYLLNKMWEIHAPPLVEVFQKEFLYKRWPTTTILETTVENWLSWFFKLISSRCYWETAKRQFPDTPQCNSAGCRWPRSLQKHKQEKLSECVDVCERQPLVTISIVRMGNLTWGVLGASFYHQAVLSLSQYLVKLHLYRC